MRAYTRVYIRSFRSRHAHVLRDEQPPSVSYHIVRAVWETARRRGRDIGERKKESKRGCEREEGRRKRERLERGEVAFNQSPASKCTAYIHVYVYRERWTGRGIGRVRERRAVYGSVSFCSGGCLEIGAKLVRRTRRGSRCLGLRDARH